MDKKGGRTCFFSQGEDDRVNFWNNFSSHIQVLHKLQEMKKSICNTCHEQPERETGMTPCLILTTSVQEQQTITDSQKLHVCLGCNAFSLFWNKL